MNRDWLKQTVTVVKNWHGQYFQVDDYSELLASQSAPLDQQLDQWIEASSQPFKHDQTTSVAKLDVGASSFVLKRYNARTQGHKYKRALRRSRARRCWFMSYAFANAGLNVAPPVLMYECRAGLIRKNAYFVNQFLVGDELLELLPDMDQAQQQQVVTALKHAFECMRQYKISHGDLKASNLLWVNEQLFFIDLDAATQHRMRLMWRVSHLRDCKRFLKNWQQNPELLALFSWMER